MMRAACVVLLGIAAPAAASAAAAAAAADAPIVFNVVTSCGAIGDCSANDTAALQRCFNKAVNATKTRATIVLPAGYCFLTWPLSLDGCQQCTLQINSLVQAPPAALWDGHVSPYGTSDLVTVHASPGFHLTGNGTIDGNGLTWRTLGDGAPYLLLVRSSTNVTITGLSLNNGPTTHIVLDQSNIIVIQNVTMVSPPGSDTDGIALVACSNVRISFFSVTNYDDGISVLGGSSNIYISDSTFNGSHGISIGGLLGKDQQVANVSAVRCAFIDALAAVRIKASQNATGIVQNASFDQFTVTRVMHPIWLDQFYCADDTSSCGQSVYNAGMVYRGIAVTNLKGTQCSGYAGVVNCSFADSERCYDLSFQNVSVTADAACAGVPNQFSCLRASGVATNVSPAGCFL